MDNAKITNKMNYKLLLVYSGIIILWINPGRIITAMAADDLKQGSDNDTTVWYDATQFEILGQAWTDLAHPYDRLPVHAETKVRPELWRLSTHSSGLVIYFSSNATSIHVRWYLRYNADLSHMAATGVKGVDLYAWNEGKWQFINCGRPSGKENETKLITGMSSEWKEFLLYLPLYDGIDSLFIGINSNSEIRSPGESRLSGKPIIFYGTSITQGGCATRPGMAYTSIIERQLGREVINLGFSGNGRMEPELAELMSGIDAACYVIDCLPNLNSEQVTERTIPFVELLKGKQPEIPVLLIESVIPEDAFFNQERRSEVEAKNKNLFASFQQLQQQGIQKLYYVPWEKLVGYDHEATVDGVHYTDLGFMRYADRIIQYLEGILEKE